MYGGRSQVAWPCPPQAGGIPSTPPQPARAIAPPPDAHIKIILMRC